MRTFVAALMFLALSAAAFAQPAKDEKEPPFELFAGYSYLHEDGRNFNGWTAAFVASINKWVGIAADFDGHYRTENEGSFNLSVSEHGFTFGPHFSFPNRSRVTPVAFALFGLAHGSGSGGGVSISENSFAMNIGGGVDVRLKEWLAARMIQVDAAYTRFGGEGTTSPRISAGLVFKFGKK